MNINEERKAIFEYFEESRSALSFDEQALKTFHFQYKYNDIYRTYCDNLRINPKEVIQWAEIPCLPISAYKYHEVKTGQWAPQETFMSSGTTSNTIRSKHFIKSTSFYHQNAAEIWSQQMGDAKKYCYLALLPGYLERDGSSLISMVHHLISASIYEHGGFYLREDDRLLHTLQSNHHNAIPTVLFGVSYALLDFIENHTVCYPDLIVIETGGMKGQRAEITKAELHAKIKAGFGSSHITSEYGMTELLSQAYAKENGIFRMHDRLRVKITQINDPLTTEKVGKSGIVNVIDLANIDSCCFIQTQDVGIDHGSDEFSILGRLDEADLRGCNLMIDEIS
jgi:phenylacetate-coenzyme A ligase PaaK-like adenylate-forming protein